MYKDNMWKIWNIYEKYKDNVNPVLLMLRRYTLCNYQKTINFRMFLRGFKREHGE